MKVVKKGALIGLLAGAILGVAMAVWVAVPVKSPGSVSRFWEEVFGSLNIVAVVLTYVYTKFVHTVEFGDMIYPLLICIVLQWALVGAGVGAGVGWFSAKKRKGANQSATANALDLT